MGDCFLGLGGGNCEVGVDEGAGWGEGLDGFLDEGVGLAIVEAVEEEVENDEVVVVFGEGMVEGVGFDRGVVVFLIGMVGVDASGGTLEHGGADV